MAYYDAFVTKWAELGAGTTAEKLAALNAATVSAPQKSILSPSAILNAIVFDDLAALTQLQVTQLTLLLSGASIDASNGTSIRTGIVALFADKTTTLTQLGELVAPFDSATEPWWKNAGYSRPFDLGDVTAAGVS